MVEFGKREVETTYEAKSLVGLTAHYKTSSYVTSKEVLRYDSKDIVADFGGYLGLLLGFSILNLFDLMLEAAEKIGVATKRKRDINAIATDKC